MGEIIGDTACPGCREQGRDKTGNHLILFADGGGHCTRCGYTMLPGGQKQEMTNERVDTTFEEVAEFPTFGIPRKKISKEACEAFGVRTEFNGEGEPTTTWYPHTTSGHV
ncbi:MAG: DnaB-like helicase C-terminal domain-containing protein, partial [Candidatus Thorarchaeota archaeon]